jgi:hypothetical protein
MTTSNQALLPAYPGIYGKLRPKITLHLDAGDENSMTITNGIRAVNLESARGVAQPTDVIHFMADDHALWDYRSGGKFTVAFRFIPGPGMFLASPTTEHILAQRAFYTGRNPGWTISAVPVASGAPAVTYWYIKVQLDGYSFRTTIVYAGGTVALRWDPAASAGDRLAVYINGTKETTKADVSGSEPSSVSGTNPNAPFFVGWHWNFSGGTYGSIMKADGIYTELRYWTRALSDAEVTTHHNGGLTPSHAQLISATDLNLGTSLGASWDFNENADGTATDGANLRVDAIGNKVLTPYNAANYNNRAVVAAPIHKAVERRNNKGTAGGYVDIDSGYGWEYKTATTPRASAFTSGVTNWFPDIWKTRFPTIGRSARLVGANFANLLDHTVGCIMYSVRYSALHASEEWDVGAVVNDSAPSAYMLMGYSNFSGTYRWQLRTENNPDVGGGNNSNLIAGPATNTRYLVNIYQSGSGLRFRITNIETGETLEQTTANVNTTPTWWWPSAWAGKGTGTVSEVEYVNFAGNEAATSNAEYGRDFIFAKNLTATENLQLESWLLSRLR